MTAFLRPAPFLELEGNRLRLYVERAVYATRPEREHGFLYLSPSGDPAAKDFEAMVRLPLDQADALAEAAAAFNAVLDRQEAGQATVGPKRKARR